MPELPEVETVRRTLKELIVGKKIIGVTVGWPKMIKKPEQVEQFTDALVDETIIDVHRRGKFLIIETSHYSLVSHLRMEGKYGVYEEKEELLPHTHVIFHFDDDTSLRYRDVRKFGTMHLYTIGQEYLDKPLSELGPEPFSKEFHFNYLFEKLQKTERAIKAVLLDQTIVVGLGNIYVDEVLFKAGIDPERKSKTITLQETEKLTREIVSTLTIAVEAGGSTIRSYINSQGKVGTYQNQLFVYGRKDEACRVCGSPIYKKVTAGRGTHYCANCQS
ncbi:5-hydroxymethyluracil DNA glycosylase [Bacillus coahuilensis p1.1.43]|uniref:Formamidopyrimidine-DNA glycosylase n=1 Tax=Bacillus coahuilensis p1.1.43 TaxID=1150625 RepID=A0A147K6S5_9BACI|nr:DNA-formamidopyrimidine glycosylase [Bacillus coahuilensis]KUP05571.1 5-hydroxymethyluracil DNA glycosylase [Bacillus coahuilensis p1.1.43]